MTGKKLTLEEMMKETKPGVTMNEFWNELIARIQKLESTLYYFHDPIEPKQTSRKEPNERR